MAESYFRIRRGLIDTIGPISPGEELAMGYQFVGAQPVVRESLCGRPDVRDLSGEECPYFK